ncbi:hypothetical protein SAMN05445504_8385 [Burkholderia sp. CF099]|nr:hypothetical protein SAMN05445504_8385 [Burkholderia sp. CF099]
MNATGTITMTMREVDRFRLFNWWLTVCSNHGALRSGSN